MRCGGRLEQVKQPSIRSPEKELLAKPDVSGAKDLSAPVSSIWDKIREKYKLKSFRIGKVPKPFNAVCGFYDEDGEAAELDELYQSVEGRVHGYDVFG
jgi:hypothetical protein